ncbi:MAG: bifunctional folylpolyglutamate synthase/dihydrofolate synthase [Deltaproteobacteria bacterium]|nr:bifunctional folylpolyglutamate synthase/dihydrofolate synthase [Deltaproteobacteria bacterium]
MYALRRFGIILGLATIKQILEGLGNPQDRFECIHVAGTNGKGSIASALAAILHASGYKVGLYTSPHLVRFNERIRINNRPITDENVVASYEAVTGVYHGTREPTFFEYSTAMALHEFGRQNVDLAVIETGMGGRLDATNVIQPVLAIISNISVEHRMYLGNTIAQIATEKGGIIKRRRPVVTGVKQKKALSVIKGIASKNEAPLYRLGDQFRVRRSKEGTFRYHGLDNVWRNMQTGLLGNYQIDNAALVLAACELLNRNALNIPLECIREGLENNHWPGRLEIVSKSPLILLDGAHNFIAARNLGNFLSKNLANQKVTLVVGMLDDKPYAGILRSLLPHCSKVILTRPRIERALPPEALFSVAREIVSDITTIPDVAGAIKYAIDTTSPHDAICIAGSLYVVGEAKQKRSFCPISALCSKFYPRNINYMPAVKFFAGLDLKQKSPFLDGHFLY